MPKAYSNYSLDVCLQALSPCRVGLMPTVLGLVYVAAWIDPQPQCRAQRWPTSCCKHLQHHTAAWDPVCIHACVCARTTCIYGDRANPHHRAAHLLWTAPSLRPSGSAQGLVSCSCSSAETHLILLIVTLDEIISRLTTSGISTKCLFTLEQLLRNIERFLKLVCRLTSTHSQPSMERF